MFYPNLKKTCLFLSPHLDDAILSCGGFINFLLKNGHQIWVVNIFTEGLSGKISQAARTHLSQSKFRETESLNFFEMRREEDKKAWSVLGLKPQNLSFIDASWRIGPQKNFLYKDEQRVFYGEISIADEELINKIKNKVIALTSHKKDRLNVFCPLGIGNHVDHLIARIATEAIFDKIFYWEDVPYNNNREKRRAFFQLNKDYQKIFEYRDNFSKKKMMLENYSSQILSLFPSGLNLKKEIFYKKLPLDDFKVDSFPVLGLPISVVNLEKACNLIFEWAKNKNSRTVSACTVNDLMQARKIKTVKTALLKSDLNTPDGMPLVWIGQKIYHKKISRVYGPDLMAKILARTEGKPIRHFFYGGDKKTLGLLIKKIKNKYPGILIAGYFSPPFRELSKNEEKEVLEKLKKNQADIIWVGLGVPKQNIFIGQFHSFLPSKILIGVGAAFDFLSGTKRQAPLWMQHAGLEWLFRFLSEPKRLWRRYLPQIPCFIILVSLELMKKFLDKKLTER